MVPGQSYSYEDLLYRMIALSDNHARDLLLKGITDGDIAGLMAAINAREVYSNGHIYITARAYSAFFRVLYNSSLLGRSMSEYALSLLAEGYLQDGLRRDLPEGVTVASKFGVHSLDTHSGPEYQFHECGIVYQPGAPYVLCVMTKSDQTPPEGLADLVADVSRIVWSVRTHQEGARSAPTGVADPPEMSRARGRR
jgi:beta-lactamase class A